MKKTTILFIILLGSLLSLNAQVKIFEGKYYHYIGLINGYDKVVMDMASHDNFVKAKLYYVDKNKSYYLTGKYNGDEIIFEINEYDKYYNMLGIIGELRIIVDGNSLKGVLYNSKKQRFPFEAKENYVSSAKFKYYYYNNLFYMKNIKSYPTMLIDKCSFIVTSAPTRVAYSKIIADYSKSIFETKNGSTDFKSIFINNINNSIKDFNKETVNFEKELKDNEYAKEYYCSEFKDSLAVEYNDKNLLVLINSLYGYMGGAHGFFRRDFYMYDLLSGKRLTFADIFLVSKKDEILKLLIKTIEADTSLQEDINISSVSLTEKIYFDNHKVYFVYNEYEIASYASGELSFGISFDKLDKYLTNYFKAKINMN